MAAATAAKRMMARFLTLIHRIQLIDKALNSRHHIFDHGQEQFTKRNSQPFQS